MKSTFKIPQIRKLPSGAWFCQLRIDGKSISITDEDYNQVYAKAVAIKAGIYKTKRAPGEITLGEAIDKYINNRDGVLSPSTISTYKHRRKNCFQDIMHYPLKSLTQSKLQQAVNAMAKQYSYKYVTTSYGLIQSVLREELPDENFRIIFPQKVKREYTIPTPDDIKKIVEACRGTPIELPVLLAVWLGLRVSEIRGIEKSAITNGILHVKKVIVDVDRERVEKTTKTYSGDRYLPVPAYIQSLIDAVPNEEKFIVSLSSHAIYKRFVNMCNKIGISQHYRFHDLRHANASVMLALGVPNKYAQERMGHATDDMLKNVYQHTMSQRTDEYAIAINNYFDNLFANEVANKTE